MNPGALFPDIGNIEKVGIDPFFGKYVSKGRLMHPRRAGGDDHPVDGEITDILFDQILAGIGTEITVVTGNLDSGEGSGKRGEFMTIDRGSDIRSTVTDVNAYFFVH
jgi:hypothetical protein